MPLEVILPLAIFGCALSLGFFFVRAAGRTFIMTRFGNFQRATEPIGYWFWTVYYYSSLTLIVLVLIGILLDALA